MPSVSLYPFIAIQVLDDDGNPAVGGKLYTYIAGSEDDQPTYTTSSGDVENTNPIVLDGAGRANIFPLTSGNYRYDLYDSNDVLLWTRDNISTTISGDESGVVLTTTDQTVQGTKVWEDVAGFGASSIIDVQSAPYQMVIGSSDTGAAGLEIVSSLPSGVCILSMTNEIGSSAGGIQYNQSDGSLWLRAGGQVLAKFKDNNIVDFPRATSITLSGGVEVITDADIIPIENGGTGEITANAALNALLPDQTSNGGKVLTTDGTNTSWAISTGLPKFLAQPYEFFSGGTQPTWTQFNTAVAGIPSGAVAVMIETFGYVEGSDNPVTPKYACQRVDATKGNTAGQPQTNTFILASYTEGRDSNIDASGFSNTDVYPVRVDGTFDYIVQATGDPLVCHLRIKGYF